MAPRKKSPTNGGRVTTRDLLDAVTNLGKRIDSLHTRDDAAAARHQQLSDQMGDLHTGLHDLREVTNDRLHVMEADISLIKRPLLLVTSGWSKTVAFSGGFGAVLALVARLELWRFIPGL